MPDEEREPDPSELTVPASPETLALVVRRGDLEVVVRFRPTAEDDPSKGDLDLTVDDPRLPHLVAGVVTGSGLVTRAGLVTRGPGREIVGADLRSGAVLRVLRDAAVSVRTYADLPALTFWDLADADFEGDGPELRVRRTLTPEHAAQLGQAVQGQLGTDGESSEPRRRVRGAQAAEQLAEVVRLYRKAVEMGDPAPRQTIADRLKYSNEHIGRLLVKARQQGLLGPAKAGKPGERDTL